MKHLQKLNQTLKALNYTMVLFSLLGAYLVIQVPDFLYKSDQVGRLMGKAALFLLILILIPGIAKRFQIFPWLVKVLMPLRRQLGILMYLFGLSHWLFIFTAPNIAIGNFPPSQLTPVITFGLFSMFILLPLFLTSNDYSVRLLKQNWARVHKLVYLSLIFVSVHLLLQQNLLAYLTAAFFLLEIFSHMFYSLKNRPKSFSSPN